MTAHAEKQEMSWQAREEALEMQRQFLDVRRVLEGGQKEQCALTLCVLFSHQQTAVELHRFHCQQAVESI